MKQIVILASASKRRSQILTSCGIKHKVAVSNAVEAHGKGASISAIVVKNAKAKAIKIAPRYKYALIIGADTLVRCGSSLIGKPRSAKEAKALLKRFSGKRIEVFTGVFVIDTLTGKAAKGCEKSSLYAQRLTKAEIDKFFKLLGPYDKAGGFSIEGVGSLLFDDIRGSYFNILGLPMITLRNLFKKLGLEILDFIM
ncbi:MAG: nucleoside triphosphate pyrophosphatase [Candidatus Omnitrophota bacterium]